MQNNLAVKKHEQKYSKLKVVKRKVNLINYKQCYIHKHMKLEKDIKTLKIITKGKKLKRQRKQYLNFLQNKHDIVISLR